jgi:hypothetical protein
VSVLFSNCVRELSASTDVSIHERAFSLHAVVH